MFVFSHQQKVIITYDSWTRKTNGHLFDYEMCLTTSIPNKPGNRKSLIHNFVAFDLMFWRPQDLNLLSQHPVSSTNSTFTSCDEPGSQTSPNLYCFHLIFTVHCAGSLDSGATRNLLVFCGLCYSAFVCTSCNLSGLSRQVMARRVPRPQSTLMSWDTESESQMCKCIFSGTHMESWLKINAACNFTGHLYDFKAAQLKYIFS